MSGTHRYTKLTKGVMDPLEDAHQPEPDTEAVLKYRRLVEDADVALFQTGADGRIWWVNEAAARIVGYGSAEEFARSVRDIREIYVDPARRDELLRLIDADGSVTDFEYEMRRKDGAIRWISLNARKLPPADGAGPGFEGIFTDVTDRRLLHASLEAVSSRLDPVEALSRFASVLERVVPFEQVTLAVIEGDTYRRMVSISSSGGPNLFPRDERVPLAGNPMGEVVTTRRTLVLDDTSDGKYEFDRVLESRGISSYAILPLADDSGTVFATFSVGAGSQANFGIDVVKLLESITGGVANAVKNILLFELEREANERLEAIDSLRKDLLAWISHDLRSPLAVIKGSAEVVAQLWDRLTEDEKRERLHVIVRQSERMDALLKRDLEIALMESGELKCKREPFDLATLVREAAEDLAGAEKSREFKTEISESVPNALGDKERSEQVMGNLLSNAVKFSPAGSVITLSVSSGDEGVHVGVHNEGPGIEESRLAEIFDKMTRLDPKREGTGLGLYITKYLVEAQGGSIAASSAPGGGVSFRFTIPIAARRSEPEPAVPST